MTEHTRAKWVIRIREWRESGLSVEDFTTGKDYAAANLRWAVSQVVAEKAAGLTPAPARPKAPRRRRAAESSAAPAPLAPRFVPVRVRRVEHRRPTTARRPTSRVSKGRMTHAWSPRVLADR